MKSLISYPFFFFLCNHRSNIFDVQFAKISLHQRQTIFTDSSINVNKSGPCFNNVNIIIIKLSFLKNKWPQFSSPFPTIANGNTHLSIQKMAKFVFLGFLSSLSARYRNMFFAKVWFCWVFNKYSTQILCSGHTKYTCLWVVRSSTVRSFSRCPFYNKQ